MKQNIKQFYFYILKENYLRKHYDPQIPFPKLNKSKTQGRPYILGIKDSRNKDIFWMVPCSSSPNKIAKIKTLKKYKNWKLNYLILPIKMLPSESCLLFNKIFPCTSKYIDNYKINGRQIMIRNHEIKNRILINIPYQQQKLMSYNLYLKRINKPLNNIDIEKLYAELKLELAKTKLKN